MEVDISEVTAKIRSKAEATQFCIELGKHILMKIRLSSSLG